MKTEIVIPKGYRRLRRNEIIRKGDLYRGEARWHSTRAAGFKLKVEESAYAHYIRPIEVKGQIPPKSKQEKAAVGRKGKS